MRLSICYKLIRGDPAVSARFSVEDGLHVSADLKPLSIQIGSGSVEYHQP